MEDTVSSPETSGRRSKVSRLIKKYGLDGLGDEMERRWTATDDERLSLRELAAHFNQELLANAMEEAGMQPLDGEVENNYELLTSEEKTDADTVRIRRRLERDGVPINDLIDDFVSYQAVRTYLKQDRGAEYSRDSPSRTTASKHSIQRLRGRTASVTQSRVAQLRDNNDIDLGDFQVIVDISILCETCGSRYEVDELIDGNGCDCHERVDRAR